MSGLNSFDTFIDISKVEIIDVYVTQKIREQYLKEFIKTNLELNHKIVDEYSYIWYNFIEAINLYEIYLFVNSTSDFDILPTILANFYESDTKSTDLFLCKSFFAVYQDGKLFSFRTFENSTVDDIKTFVIQKYKLNIDNVYNIDDSTLKHLQQKENKHKIDFIKPIDDKSYLYFLYYGIASCIIFAFVVYWNYFDAVELKNNEYKKLEHKLTTIKSKKINHKVTIQIVEIFKYIKLNGIVIDEIKYADKQLVLDLYHEDKQKLLDFLTLYDKKVVLEQLNFLEDKQIFKMVLRSEI